MARRQGGKLHPPTGEKGIEADEKCVGPSRTKLAKAALISWLLLARGLDLQSHRACCRLQVFPSNFCRRCIRQIAEHLHTRSSGRWLAQKFQPLSQQLIRQKINTSQIAVWLGETGDKTASDGVFDRRMSSPCCW